MGGFGFSHLICKISSSEDILLIISRFKLDISTSSVIIRGTTGFLASVGEVTTLGSTTVSFWATVPVASFFNEVLNNSGFSCCILVNKAFVSSPSFVHLTYPLGFNVALGDNSYPYDIPERYSSILNFLPRIGESGSISDISTSFDIVMGCARGGVCSGSFKLVSGLVFSEASTTATTSIGNEVLNNSGFSFRISENKAFVSSPSFMHLTYPLGFNLASGDNSYPSDTPERYSSILNFLPRIGESWSSAGFNSDIFILLY